MNLNSKKYPNINYEKGEEIWLTSDDSDIPFYFDVDEELTEDDKAMEAVAFALDEVDIFKKKAIDFLKTILTDSQNKYYHTVSYFLEFHRDELDSEIFKKLFKVNDPQSLPLEQMIDFLEINRFGSFIDDDLEQQVFIMDFSFDPNITDELLVIYFDLNKEILMVSHES